MWDDLALPSGARRPSTPAGQTKVPHLPKPAGAAAADRQSDVQDNGTRHMEQLIKSINTKSGPVEAVTLLNCGQCNDGGANEADNMIVDGGDNLGGADGEIQKSVTSPNSRDHNVE